MGIKGSFDGYMKNLQRVACWEHEKVITGYLVLDGNAVLFHICKTAAAKISWCQGGQYGELRTEVHSYIDKLEAGKITPIFVFDGIDSQQKLRTKFERRDQISSQICACLSKMESLGYSTELANEYRNVKALMSTEVFRDVLIDRKISFRYADGEADPVIAALANHHCCYAVSNDSDFYIFDIKKGYIPLDRLKFESDSKVIADVYNQKAFCTAFGLNRRQYLAIPVLMGADSIDRVEIGQGSTAESSMRLLTKSKSFRDLKKNCRGTKFDEEYKKAAEFYEVDDPTKARCLISVEETRLCYSDGTALPTWLLEKYREGYFAPSLMKATIHHKSLLSVVPDDPKKEAALTCSRPIRQAIYGMLAGSTVEEFIRNISESVNRVRILDGEPLPDTSSIESLNDDQRKFILCKILGCNTDLVHVEGVERKWQLVIAASNFWAKRANPKPSEKQIKALVLTFLIASDSNGKYDTKCTPFKTWKEAFHCYAQWQCVYKDSMMLNNILMNPLGHVSPSDLFDGKMVMHYVISSDLDGTIEEQPSQLKEMLYKLASCISPVTSFP